MAYLLMTIFLSFLTILDILVKDRLVKNFLFYLASVAVILFCSLRYAVGYDFYSYNVIYNLVPDNVFNNMDLNEIKGEFLFLKFFSLLKSFNISYEIASSVTLFLINVFFVSFIKKYSPYKVLSVLLLYSLYFVYVFSTLRQGLAIALFLCFCFNYLEKKEYTKYYIFCFLLIFIHLSSFVLLLLPIIIKYYHLLKNKEVAIIIILFGLSFLMAPILVNILSSLNLEAYSEEIQVNYGALAIRALLVFVIYISFPSNSTNDLMKMSRNIYICGFMIYLLLSPVDIVASRLGAYLKVFDLILLPYCLYMSRSKIEMYFFSISYSVLLIINVITGVSSYSNLEFYDYPYVTIFNKEEANGVYSPEN